MVGIPPIKMMMNGGWFIIDYCYTNSMVVLPDAFYTSVFCRNSWWLLIVWMRDPVEYIGADPSPSWESPIPFHPAIDCSHFLKHSNYQTAADWSHHTWSTPNLRAASVFGVSKGKSWGVQTSSTPRNLGFSEATVWVSNVILDVLDAWSKNLQFSGRKKSSD